MKRVLTVLILLLSVWLFIAFLAERGWMERQPKAQRETPIQQKS